MEPLPCSVDVDCDSWIWVNAACVSGQCYTPKNTYLTIAPVADVIAVAYQLEVTAAPKYAGAVARTWWLDDPVCYSADGTTTHAAPCLTAFGETWVSDAVPDPVAPRTWTETPLTIQGCAIAPVMTYAIAPSLDGVAPVLGVAPLEIMTIRQPNFDYADLTGGPTPGEPVGTSYLPPNDFTTVQDAQVVILRLKRGSTGPQTHLGGPST